MSIWVGASSVLAMCVGKYDPLYGPELLLSVPGFVQAVCCPLGAWPKRAPAPGGASVSYDEYAIMHPMSLVLAQVGMFWNVPPVFWPVATEAPPPMSSAEIMRDRTSAIGS